MGERKVASKYIPPDFDPALVPRGKKLSSKDGTVPVRMMLPFSIQCSNCHTFLYRGRKFNSKKEAMGGPDGTYLGITRWRFYIKCTHCSRPLTFLTDPQNADYEMESGGTRNYEFTKDRNKQETDAVEEEEKAAKEDPLKALETRVLDSQREMADMENLEEIRAMNARHVQLLKADDLLKKMRQEEVEEEGGDMLLTEQDEELIQSIQFGAKKRATVRRLDEEDEVRAEQERKQKAALLAERQKELENKAARQNKPKMPQIKVKRKRKMDSSSSSTDKKEKVDAAGASKNQNGGGTLSSLLGDYGSDSDSD